MYERCDKINEARCISLLMVDHDAYPRFYFRICLTRYAKKAFNKVTKNKVKLNLNLYFFIKSPEKIY